MTIQANFPNVQPSLLLDFANAKQLPPSVTFTRATTAAYYDGHTTAKAEQNLVLYSQTFSNSNWAANSATKTSTTATDPAGGSTALTLTKTGTSDYSLRQTGIAPSANKTYTVSCYLKGTAGETVNLYMDNGVDQTVVSQSVTLTASWVRYTGTGTFNSTSSNVTCGVNFGSGTTATSVDVAFFQVEERSSATAYTATTTQAITNYIPVLLTAGGGQPRFDHNPTTSESLGLLIEEQRTNLALYSADFSNAVWSKVRSSVSSNVIIAPDGTLTGDKLVEDSTASNTHFILQNIALGGSVDSSPYAVSIYAKAGERTRLQMFDNNSVSSGVTVFDLSTGTVVSGTGKIASVGNGWYRCSIYPLKDYATNSTVWIVLDNGTTTSYTGNGFSGLYIWGFQLETTSFITSYIPTTSAAATRAADVVSMSGANFSSWYSPGNGTFYAEAATASVAGDVMIAEGTNSSNGYLDFSLTFATTGTQFINRFVATNNDMRRSNVVAVNTMVKFSGSITNSSGTSVASVSGLTVSSAGSQGANFGADRMFIGSRGGSSLFINAPIKKFAFYPAQLTQTQQNSITG